MKVISDIEGFQVGYYLFRGRSKESARPITLKKVKMFIILCEQSVFNHEMDPIKNYNDLRETYMQALAGPTYLVSIRPALSLIGLKVSDHLE